jgi:hypothetical protein
VDDEDAPPGSAQEEAEAEIRSSSEAQDHPQDEAHRRIGGMTHSWMAARLGGSKAQDYGVTLLPGRRM